MDRFGVRDFSGANDRGNVEVAQGRRSGTDANRFVGELYVFRRRIDVRVHCYRFNAELAARPLDA
jgi:hypothetical protein